MPGVNFSSSPSAVCDLLSAVYDVKGKTQMCKNRFTFVMAFLPLLVFCLTLCICGTSPSHASQFTITLTNGDVVDNNEVDWDDYNAVVDAFGSLPGDSNWNANADVDGTGEVDWDDFNIVSIDNFGSVGADPFSGVSEAAGGDFELSGIIQLECWTGAPQSIVVQAQRQGDTSKYHYQTVTTGTSFIMHVPEAGTYTVRAKHSHWLRGEATNVVAIDTTPPSNIMAVATGQTSSSNLKITVYWDGVPGVLGYNVYRGTTAGGEDYLNPINGSTLITDPTWPGGNCFMFTDTTGLVADSEYFYTVKCVRTSGLSQPSDEASEIPSEYAIPWDSQNVSTIATSIQSNFYSTFDYIRAAGPDGMIYDTDLSTPQLPSGSLIPGTNLLQLTSGEIVPLPNDDGENGSDTGLGLFALRHTDGPYRKVKSKDGIGLDFLYRFAGGGGTFMLPCLDSCISLAAGTRDTPYVYLGGTNSTADVDAGVFVYTNNLGQHLFWRPTQATRLAGSDGQSYKHIYNYKVNPNSTGDFLPGTYVGMYYFIDPAAGMTALVVTGWSTGYAPQTVCIANPYPNKGLPFAGIKRIYSIAQGGPPWNYRLTGSHMWGGEVQDMVLYDYNSGYSVVDWTSGRTGEQGSYPDPVTGIVSWHVIDAYMNENNINISL